MKINIPIYCVAIHIINTSFILCLCSRQLQYCAKVMQTIIDGYHEYPDISAIFNEILPQTIYRTIYCQSYCFISRQDIVLLCEISFPASDISFPLCDISFQLCDISFLLCNISFLLCDISFLLKEISFQFIVTAL